MKILHIIYSLTIGGTETMLVDIVNEQMKKSHVELIIINNHYNENLLKKVDSRVIVHLLKRKKSSFNPYKVFLLNRIVHSYKPDVIHFHNHNALNLIFCNKKYFKCLTLHDINIPGIHLHKYDKLFAISNAVKLDINKRTGLNSYLVHNGIKTDSIDGKCWKRANDKYKIIQISRLEHNKKGQHLLLEAIHNLIYVKNVKEIEVDFLGEGPSLKYLEGLAKKYEIEAYVNFLGKRDRDFIYKIIKGYDLVIQPSLYEGFGLTVVEGIAAKVPVLVSNIDGPMEIICNGKYGNFFEVNNSMALSNSIESIMKSDIRLLKQSCEIAYNYALENFDIRTTAKTYLEQYLK